MPLVTEAPKELDKVQTLLCCYKRSGKVLDMSFALQGTPRPPEGP